MNYLIDDTTLSGIADAIRNKTGDSAQMEVSEMASEINSIVTEPAQIEKSITANGVYNASDDNTYGYSKVTVDVPLPENGYLLKELSDLPASSASIQNASALPLAELKAEITPTQIGTPWWAAEDDKTPYLFRPSPQIGHDYNRVYEDAIVGGSMAWNQLCDYTEIKRISNSSASGSTTIQDRTVSVTFTSNESGWRGFRIANNIPLNHKILLIVSNSDCSLEGDYSYSIRSDTIAGSVSYFTIPKNQASAKILNSISSVLYGIRWPEGSPDFTMSITDPQIVDLTLMFGQAIADYIYTLEQSEAGSGIAWLKSQGFFTKDYYAYDAGSIKSVQTSAKKTIGFNQWDEQWEAGGFYSGGGKDNGKNAIRSKNFIPVLPNTQYFKKGFGASGKANYTVFYDETQTKIDILSSTSPNVLFTTPSNCAYIKFDVSAGYGTTYNNDICINIHSSRDGEYEAYEEHTYLLDSDLELRGMPKLDSNNNLYYDGDTYASDGTVTRKYGIVDLGTLDWTYDSNNSRFYSSAITGIKNTTMRTLPMICSKYEDICDGRGFASIPDKSIYNSTTQVYIHDSSYTDAASFKTAMSGVYLVYELATATSESADPYVSPQIVSNFGTEEFIDSRDVPVPVGHETRYYNEAPIVGFTEMVITRTAGADSKTYTVDLSGTIYGGVLDVVKGELSITYGIVDLGTLSWQYSSMYSRFTATFSGYKHPSSNNVPANIICTKYRTVASNDTAVDGHDKEIGANGNSDMVAVRDLAYSNAETFTTAMSGTYLVYELETQTTVTLTPTAVATLLGSNTLTASTGDIASVKYFSKE